MKFSYRELMRHSGVYAVAQVLGRLASFVLLPVYTRHLSPADYGCVALVDLTTTILSILIGSGMTSAMGRFHFEAAGERQRDQIWWAGVSFLALSATVVVLPVLWLRHDVEPWLLGSGAAGGMYLALALPQLWLNAQASGLDTHLRIYKQSGTILALTVLRLSLNISLNLLFLIVLDLGVFGILAGNLLTSLVQTGILALLFASRRGSYAFDSAVVQRLWRYGRPLILAALLGMVMHQADRYLLRWYLDLSQVGVYSIAYTIAQAIAVLCTSSFNSIWGVMALEVAGQPNAKQVYARVFEQFVSGLILVMLGVSLGAEPLLRLMAPPAYVGAASLIPIICLSYVVFSLNDHFALPIVVAKRTTSLLPASAAGAAVNVGANLLLIPRLGIAGAAWATLVSFVVYAAIGLYQGRRFDVYPYPFARLGSILLGVLLTYGSIVVLRRTGCDSRLVLALSALAWTGWLVLLLGPLVQRELTRRRSRASLDAASVC